MTIICLLRAVNLGGYNKLNMQALRAMCESAGFSNPRTLLQSGNVVFQTGAQNLTRLSKRIEDAIEQTVGFRCDVILRTAAEMRQVVAASPFAGRTGLHPGKLTVTFLAADPGEQARETVRQIRASPEELFIQGREIYIYFPNGMGRTKLPVKQIEKALNTPGTARNWNTVTKLLEMAEQSA
jgi:uncharacterized protein (DUF1697 family)